MLSEGYTGNISPVFRPEGCRIESLLPGDRPGTQISPASYSTYSQEGYPFNRTGNYGPMILPPILSGICNVH